MQSLSPLVLPVTVALPGVTLIHICAKPIRAPDQVPSLSLHHITAGQVLIYWDDTCVHAKCLKTYEVEYSADGNRFVRINPVDSFFNSHVFAPNPSNVKPGTSHDVLVSGSYRVRAVDFWGRAGPYSPIATYSR